MEKEKASTVLPTRNEQQSIIYQRIKETKEVLKNHNVEGGIIISDSSLDNSAIMAKKKKGLK